MGVHALGGGGFMRTERQAVSVGCGPCQYLESPPDSCGLEGAVYCL